MQPDTSRPDAGAIDGVVFLFVGGAHRILSIADAESLLLNLANAIDQAKQQLVAQAHARASTRGYDVAAINGAVLLLVGGFQRALAVAAAESLLRKLADAIARAKAQEPARVERRPGHASDR